MKGIQQSIETAYALACERYADFGVNVPSVLEQLDEIPISIQCWQGDDSYPGRA